LADLLKQLGKSEELIPRLEKLHAANPDNLSLASYLAAQYRDAGKADKAEALYRQWIQQSPSPLAYRSLMSLYRESKRYDALLSLLGQAIETVGVLDTLGTEAQAISSDADALRGVVEAARTARQAKPDSLTNGMCQAVAMLAVEAKQYETAAEFFDLALAGKPKNEAELLLAWGVALLIDDRSAEAAKVFQRGIDGSVLPKDNPAFYFYLAGALAMSDRTEEAIAAARKAGEMKPDAARFRGREAWVLYFAKRYSEAKRSYAKLVEDFEAEEALETRAVLREARLALANLSVLENHNDQAEAWLEQVLDEFPDDANALNDLGYLWADENKNLAHAHRMIQKAVEAEPDNIAYRDSLGWALFRLGRFPEAVAELEKAVVGDKMDGVVFEHLGDAYQKTNQTEKAVEAWRHAAEAFRGEKELDKAEAVEKKIPR
jgi:tetratricopeptide (TPR) repeat protein